MAVFLLSVRQSLHILFLVIAVVVSMSHYIVQLFIANFIMILNVALA